MTLPPFPLEEYLPWIKGQGLALASSDLRRLERFLAEVWEWNRVHNIVGVSSYRRLVEELLLDSLLPLPHLPLEGEMLDVGAGNGFPAVPLAILRPALDVDLVEASGRKARFLRHCVRTLGLRHVRVIEERIEAQPRPLRRRGYAVATARAVAPLEKTLAWCTPHLGEEGRLICFQGPKVGEALSRSRGVMRSLGVFVTEKVAYRLPGGRSLRHLLIFSSIPENRPMSR